MMKKIGTILFLSLGLISCGGGENRSTESTETVTLTKGYLIDSPIEGVDYICNSDKSAVVIKGVTTKTGEFSCITAPVKFSIGSYVLGTIDAFTEDNKVYPQDLLGLDRTEFKEPKLIQLIQLLQSLDDDGNISNAITITEETSKKLNGDVVENLEIYELVTLADKNLVLPLDAKKHLQQNMLDFVEDDIIAPAVPTLSGYNFQEETSILYLTIETSKSEAGSRVLIAYQSNIQIDKDQIILIDQSGHADIPLNISQVGKYTIQLAIQDKAGNIGEPLEIEVEKSDNRQTEGYTSENYSQGQNYTEESITYTQYSYYDEDGDGVDELYYDYDGDGIADEFYNSVTGETLATNRVVSSNNNTITPSSSVTSASSTSGSASSTSGSTSSTSGSTSSTSGSASSTSGSTSSTSEEIPNNTAVTTVDFTRCTPCHGSAFDQPALGKSKIISTMSKSAIKSALKGYQNGTYGGALKGVMRGQVEYLSNSEIEILGNTIGL